jgi:predicted nucleic acid-binding protein
MRIYLDASALVKRYCEKESSEIFSSIFVASDKGLIRAAKEEGLKAFNVEDSE